MFRSEKHVNCIDFTMKPVLWHIFEQVGTSMQKGMQKFTSWTLSRTRGRSGSIYLVLFDAVSGRCSQNLFGGDAKSLPSTFCFALGWGRRKARPDAKDGRFVARWVPRAATRATKHERYAARGKRERRQEGKTASRKVGTGYRPEGKMMDYG